MAILDKSNSGRASLKSYVSFYCHSKCILINIHVFDFIMFPSLLDLQPYNKNWTQLAGNRHAEKGSVTGFEKVHLSDFACKVHSSDLNSSGTGVKGMRNAGVDFN